MNLVKRLRENVRWLERDGFLTNAQNTAEAADEIERQAAVIAEAKKIIEEMCICYGHPTPDATLVRMTPNV